MVGSIWSAAPPARQPFAARLSRMSSLLQCGQPGSNWTPPPHPVAMQTSNISTFLVSLCRLCRSCGGILKPDVVFFAENVPRDQVAAAQASIEQADAMLIVGSSLMFYSGFRFAQMAARRGIPIAAVNLGRTRADDLLAARPLCIPASNRSAQSLLSQASRLDGQCQNRVQPVPIFNA